VITLPIPQTEEILFETVLELTSSSINKLKKYTGEGEIKIIFNKKNKVAIGEPFYKNITPRLMEKGQEIPNEIKQLINDYDFHYVSLTCSFCPDTDCKFTWARFGVELNAETKAGEQIKERPIAIDMFPDEILSEMKYKREMNLSPQFKFNLKVVDTKTKFGVSESKEFVAYEPQIFAYGIRRPSIAWDFKNTKEKGIWGNKRDLLLLVRTPKESKVKGRFILGAEVEVYIDRWIPIPLAKRKDDEIANAEYYLSG